MAAAPKSKKDSGNILKSIKKFKKKRPGIHAKSKTSKNKKSKNYKKLYNKQGK